MIEVQIKGGGVAQFPDGTSSDVIKSTLAREFPTTEKPSMMDGIGDALSTGIQAAGTAAVKGMAGIAGLPSDLANAKLAADKALGIDNNLSYIPSISQLLSKLPGSKDIASAMLEGTGTPAYQPESPLGKIAMEGAGMAASNMLLPGSSLLKNAAIGAASGAGGEIGGQLTEGTPFEPYARVVGSIVAPVAAVKTGRALSNIAKGASGTLETAPEVNQIISQSLQREGITPQSALSRISASDNRNLGNISSQLSSEALAQSRVSPIATNMARASANEQIAKSREAINSAISKHVAEVPEANLASLQDRIITESQKEAAPFRQQWESKDAIKGFTEVAPKRTLGTLQQRFPAVFDRVVKFSNEVGKPIDFRSMKLGDLETVKQGLDDIIYNSSDDLANTFKNSVGTPNQRGRSLLNIRGELNDFLRSKSESLSAGNDILSSNMRIRAATEHGFDVLSDKQGATLLKFSDMTKNEQQATKAGIALRMRGIVENLGSKNNVNLQRMDAISPYIGERNTNRLKAIIGTEQDIQQLAKQFTRVAPAPIKGGVSVMGEAAKRLAETGSAKGTALNTAMNVASRVLTGRGPDYMKRLSEDLTSAILSTDKSATAKRLSEILRENNRTLKDLTQRTKNSAARAAIASNSGEDRN